jgi:predicted adenylyl cyclase CyaB
VLSNIEIKASLKDRATVEAIAARLSTGGPEIIHQKDHFFDCTGARLKLRIFGREHGELIRYERPNTPGPRRSNYVIARTSDPNALLEILTATLGKVAVVKKTRTVYLVGQTRVHLDDVEGLGSFLELEVVLRPDQTDEEGQKIAEDLLRQFGIDEQELIAEAYIDLLAGFAQR